jgi:hypothetical protein
MRKRNLLLGSGVLAVAALLAVSALNSNQETSSYTPRDDFKAAYSAADAAEWEYRMRFGDGPINYQAVYDAQDKAASAISYRANYQWEELGPDNLGGRTRAVMYDRDNSSLWHNPVIWR